MSEVYAAMEKWNEAVVLLKNRLSMYAKFGTPPSSTAVSSKSEFFAILFAESKYSVCSSGTVPAKDGVN